MGVHATSHNRGNHWAIDTKVIPKTVPQSQTPYCCANRSGLTTNAAQSWASTSRLYTSLPMIKPSADPKHCNNRSSTHARRPPKKISPKIPPKLQTNKVLKRIIFMFISCFIVFLIIKLVVLINKFVFC